MKKINIKNLYLFLIIFAIEFFIALFVKDKFIRPYLGDILVIPTIYFFINIFLNNKVKFLYIYIFLFAVFVEFLQYINIVGLLGFSNIKFLKILIGTTFDFKDVLCYLIGSIILLYYEKLFLRRKI